MRPAIFSLRWGTLKDPFFQCTAVDPVKNCGMQSLTTPTIGSCQHLSLLCILDLSEILLCSIFLLHPLQPRQRAPFSELLTCS